MALQTFKVGQAPWETNQNDSGSFPIGQAPWEVQLEQPEKKVSGLQSFIQSVAKPFLKLTSSVSSLGAQGVALGAELLGRSDIAQRIDTEREKGIDYGYFGNVKELKSIPEAIGVGTEIGSYAGGGGGAVPAIKTGIKGLIAQGAKELAKVGAVTGGAMSFGQSLQEAESSPADVAYNTLFGTAVGGVAGGVLGAATPIVAKGVQKVKSYLNIPSLETKLAEGYKKIFNPTARQIKADTRFGNDSFKFLAQEMPDMPINVNSAGKIESDNAIEMAKMKYSAEATAYKPIIRNSGKYIDIDEAISNAKRAATKEFDGSDLIKAKQQIDDEVNAFLANNPQDVNVMANGKRFVTLARADDIKSYSWARGKGWGTPEAEVWNDTNNLIGHSLKDLIEKELPDAPVRAMNRRLGQWKNAIDMLERRNAQVSGSGGKLGKYIIKSVGTSVGAGLGGDQGGIGGGLVGAGSGFMTAGLLASMLSNPKIRLFVIRKILQNLNKAGRGDMIKEAEQILQEQASKYLLPAAGKSSYVEKPIILPQSARETNLGLDEVRGMNQMSKPINLETAAPNVAPATQTNTNVINPIDKSIPKNDINIKGGQQAFGGVAGIEIKKDENGKTIVNFNPTKALAGIAGLTFAQRAVKLQPLIKKFFAKEPPFGLLKDLKSLVKYVDFKELPPTEKSGQMFMKEIRTQLEKFGVDSFNMTDRKLADFADAALDKADEVPRFKQNAITGKFAGSTPAVPKGQEDLFIEARKYKSAEDFISKYKGSATQYGDYTPAIRKFGLGKGSFRITDKGVDPNLEVIIYRGVPDTKTKITDGDFVTVDRMSAESYAGRNNVISKKVKAKDLIYDDPSNFDPKDPFFTGAEFVYSDSKNPILNLNESELKKIWQQANK